MRNTPITGILLLVFHLSVVPSHTSSEIAVIVNKPLNLPCTCSVQEVKWTASHFYSAVDLIAASNKGKCRIEKDFRKRFTFLDDPITGNFSIRINSTVYNDIGYYKCTCKGELVSDLHVNVYDPVVVEVFEGDNAKLPCYGKTRRDAEDVQWMKDGGKMTAYNYSRLGEPQGGRITMSKEGFQNGDLSLLIESVRHSDASLYLCLFHKRSSEGDPRAVLLRVQKRPLEQIPPTPPSCTTQSAIIGLLVLVIIIGVITYGLRKYRETQHMAPTTEAVPVQEENPMIPKNSSTQIIQD